MRQCKHKLSKGKFIHLQRQSLLTVSKGKKEILDLRDCKGLQDPQVRLDRKGFKEKRGREEKTVLEEKRVIKAIRGNKAHREKQVQKENRGVKGWQGLRGHVVQQVHLGWQNYQLRKLWRWNTLKSNFSFN